MTIRSTDEENGRKILDIYAHFKTRPGETLKASNFVAVGTRWLLRMDDLQNGIDFARRNGWVEELDTGGIRLTETGFAAGRGAPAP